MHLRLDQGVVLDFRLCQTCLAKLGGGNGMLPTNETF